MQTPVTMVSQDQIKELLIPAVEAGHNSKVHNYVLRSLLIAIDAETSCKDDSIRLGQLASLQETFWRRAAEDPRKLLNMIPAFTAFANAA